MRKNVDGMRGIIGLIQRRWLDQVEEDTIDKALKYLSGLTVLLTVAFGAYYYFDRYAVANQSLADRESQRLEEMIFRDPGNVDLRVKLSVYYSERGEYDAALSQLQEAIRVNDRNLVALTAMGDVYMKKGDYAKAAEAYSAVVAMNANNPMRSVDTALAGVLFDLGRAYVQLGKWDEAVASLSDAVEIDKTNADAYYLLGVAYQSKGSLEEAVEQYRRAVSFVPDFKEPYQGLAQVYEKKGFRDMADWAKGMVALSAGSYDDAIKQFEALLKTRPSLFEAQAGLGMAYERKRQNEKAIDAYQKAYELNPDYRPAKDGLVRLGVLSP